MSYSLKLDAFSHDLKIVDGHFVRIQGADEVRQRIKVALYHHHNEYFLNRPGGIPWYSRILGSKMKETQIINLIREKTQRIPGVIQIMDILLTRSGRDYLVEIKALVQKGPADTQGGLMTVSGISVGG